MAVTKATLKNLSKPGARAVDVKFNPTELTITRNMLYPEVSVPGLRTPLLQFVRGQAETLQAELFLDRSTMGESIADDLAVLRAYVTIDKDLHAPPVCLFSWGDTSFQGVMFEFQEKFTMFDPEGKVLRARVTVKIKAYESAAKQFKAINQQSPDRTKSRTVRAGDRYDLIAAEEYGDPAYWKILAEANGDDRPRLLRQGETLNIPPL